METNHNDPNNSHEPDVPGINNRQDNENNNGSYDNHDSGYSSNAGYPQNSNNGYSNGYSVDGNNGYSNGYSADGNNGYSNGYSADGSNGYSADGNNGYSNGYSSGNNPVSRNDNSYGNNYFNYTKQSDTYAYSPPFMLQGNSFSTAAMILGFLSIISTMVLPFYLPFFLGSLAILFALLSKGTAKKLSGKAVAGVTCGSVGIGLNIAIFTVVLFFLLSHPEFMIEAGQIYDERIEQIYGAPSEDILGESVEDMMRELFPSYTE